MLNKFIDNYSYGHKYLGYTFTEANYTSERYYNYEDKHNVTLYICGALLNIIQANIATPILYSIG